MDQPAAGAAAIVAFAERKPFTDATVGGREFILPSGKGLSGCSKGNRGRDVK